MAGRVDILGNTAQPTAGASNPVQVTDDIQTFYSATPSRRAIADKDTEYSYALPAGASMFEARSEGGTINLAFASGQSDTNYVRLYAGEVRRFGIFKPTVNVTIYFRSDQDSDTLEVLSYA